MSTLAHTVERSVVVEAPADEVWEAITDESLLSEWLADEVELDPRAGGEVVCRYEDGEERRGEVTLVEEAEQLAFEWRRRGEAPSRVELVVEAVARGTRVVVTESGPARSASPLLAAGWSARLGALSRLPGRLVRA